MLGAATTGMLESTAGQRDALRAFTVIEGVALFLSAPSCAAIAGLGGEGVQTASQGYVKYAVELAYWFGAASIPVSVAWMFARAAKRGRPAPHWKEAARVVIVEALVIELFAVVHVVLGAPFMEAPPEWADIWLFARWLLIMSVISFFWARGAVRKASQVSAPNSSP